MRRILIGVSFNRNVILDLHIMDSCDNTEKQIKTVSTKVSISKSILVNKVKTWIENPPL